MKFFQLPLFATAVSAAAIQTRANETALTWTKCGIPTVPSGTVPGECGSLTVPLDYTDESSEETINLELYKVLATKPGDTKKSIFLNFGGPGATGIQDLGYYSSRIQAATGGIHDLIVVVPRGTGKTLPYSCYDRADSRNAGKSVLAGNASDAALGFVWAKGNLVAKTCETGMGEKGKMVGTAFVARDIMQVVDNLHEDGKLRYWGVSYGTVLGSTLTALFPERVDKVVLDGVVNIHEYYANRETQLMESFDATFRQFVNGCYTNPDKCSLVALLEPDSADDLEQKIVDGIETYKYNPVPVYLPGYVGEGIMMEYSLIVPIIASNINFMQLWPSLAGILVATLSRNITLIDAILGGVVSLEPTAYEDALPGIKCSDMLWRTDDFDEMKPIFAGRQANSRWGSFADEMPARCAQWKLDAKERYDGDFSKVKSANPLLIIGNTYDPVTPLVSARNVSKTFEGSVLLEHGMAGHVSLTTASICTVRAIRDYFVKGDLPKPDTKCEIDVAPFTTGDGWAAVLKQLAADDA